MAPETTDDAAGEVFALLWNVPPAGAENLDLAAEIQNIFDLYQIQSPQDVEAVRLALKAQLVAKSRDAIGAVAAAGGPPPPPPPPPPPVLGACYFSVGGTQRCEQLTQHECDGHAPSMFFPGDTCMTPALLAALEAKGLDFLA